MKTLIVGLVGLAIAQFANVIAGHSSTADDARAAAMAQDYGTPAVFEAAMAGEIS